MWIVFVIGSNRGFKSANKTHVRVHHETRPWSFHTRKLQTCIHLARSTPTSHDLHNVPLSAQSKFPMFPAVLSPHASHTMVTQKHALATGGTTFLCITSEIQACHQLPLCHSLSKRNSGCKHGTMSRVSPDRQALLRCCMQKRESVTRPGLGAFAPCD